MAPVDQQVSQAWMSLPPYFPFTPSLPVLQPSQWPPWQLPFPQLTWRLETLGYLLGWQLQQLPSPPFFLLPPSSGEAVSCVLDEPFI